MDRQIERLLHNSQRQSELIGTMKKNWEHHNRIQVNRNRQVLIMGDYNVGSTSIKKRMRQKDWHQTCYVMSEFQLESSI